ncbi:MAG: tyrosine recombinase XerD, partial [Alloprevotella sp.]
MWRNCRIFVCKITKSQVILKTRAIKLLIISFMNDSSSELSKPQVADTSALLEKYRLFLLLEQGLSENTRMAYQRDVERFLEFLAEVNTPVLEVRLPLLHEYTQHLFALGVAARSMARMLSGVRSFYRFLQLDGHLAQDPTELLESPRIPKHLPAVLSLEEVEAILGAIDQSKPEGQRDHALLELLYSCGLRVSEVCTLKLSDLFLEEGFIRVTGKGDKQRIVPISPRAIHELHNWFDARANIAVKPEDEDFVFVSSSRGRHLSRITVFHNIKQYVQA